jgi:hypothetical protein
VGSFGPIVKLFGKIWQADDRSGVRAFAIGCAVVALIVAVVLGWLIAPR